MKFTSAFPSHSLMGYEITAYEGGLIGLGNNSGTEA